MLHNGAWGGDQAGSGGLSHLDRCSALQSGLPDSQTLPPPRATPRSSSIPARKSARTRLQAATFRIFGARAAWISDCVVSTTLPWRASAAASAPMAPPKHRAPVVLRSSDVLAPTLRLLLCLRQRSFWVNT